MTTKVETYVELTELVGRAGLMDMQAGLRVRVHILEAKRTYGRTRVRVEPEAGEGTAWVYLERVKLEARA
jgi:hypothetical protein